jgi:hypothetical protein
VLAGVTLCDPLVASAPFQPPLDVHEFALPLDQFSVALLPAGMLDGLAVRLTVGAGAAGSKKMAFTMALIPLVRLTTICTWPLIIQLA